MTDNLLEQEADVTNLPDKFQDPETGAVRLQALIDSYMELERKQSQAPSVPKTPEEYCVDCSHGLFEADAGINRRLHEKGFTPEQVQLVYDLAAERMVPMIMDMAGEFQADREVERLIEHFGGQDKWKEVSRQLLAFGRKNLPPDVLDSLSISFEGVLALEGMMKGEEPSISPSGEAQTGSGEAELHALMRDPKYWRDKDPATVAKVTEGFQRLFGSS